MPRWKGSKAAVVADTFAHWRRGRGPVEATEYTGSLHGDIEALSAELPDFDETALSTIKVIVGAATSSSDTFGVPITVHCIGDYTVDPDGAWQAVTGLKPDGALLVRPDEFVGWRADELPVDPNTKLCEELSAILARS
jgi:aromatic ring hydroxylase-like protein